MKDLSAPRFLTKVESSQMIDSRNESVKKSLFSLTCRRYSLRFSFVGGQGKKRWHKKNAGGKSRIDVFFDRRKWFLKTTRQSSKRVWVAQSFIRLCDPNSNKPYSLIRLSLKKGDSKTPFSIATTPRCRGRRYSFPRISSLYP